MGKVKRLSTFSDMMKILEKINGNKTMYCLLAITILESDILPLPVKITSTLINVFYVLGGLSGCHKVQKHIKKKKTS